MHTFRPGAIGALLDEYERAIGDLKRVIAAIPDSALTPIVDPNTGDENCRSIQSILTHVVSAAYGYATSIHNQKGHNLQRPPKAMHATIAEYQQDLTLVVAFTESVLKEFADSELEELDVSRKIKTSWGQHYDVEQLTEHAIVHVLRHRRQIERFEPLWSSHTLGE